MKLLLILFISYISIFNSYSQGHTLKKIAEDTTGSGMIEIIKTNTKSKYLKFLIAPDSSSQNHLFSFSYQYMLNPIGKTIGSQGMISNFGINLARFFSKKIIIGISLDLKWIPGMSTKKINNEFTSDFNSHFIKQYDNPQDSANAYIMKTVFNNGYGPSLYGNGISNIGIMISLFPQKYGGVLLNFKTGNTSFKIHSVYDNPYVKNGKVDAAYLTLINNYIIDITFKPYAFFKNAYVSKINSFGFNDILKRFVISVFYQRLNFSSAEFNGTKISSMVDSAFNSKYKTDNRFGIKLGWGIY